MGKHLGIDLLRYGANFFNKKKTISYDAAWNVILERKQASSKNVPGAFVDFDNSPRYGSEAKIYAQATPEKFQNYFSRLICKARDEYKKDFIFLTAWNEWAEGSYLEPDKKYGYGYLEAVRNALQENGEFPDKNEK